MNYRKHDADLHYRQAIRAFNTAHGTTYNQSTTVTEAQLRIAFAHVSAIREQTAVLERIAAALERRDVVELEWWREEDDINRRLSQGWVYLGEQRVPPQAQWAPKAVLGRPRNVPVEGGGEAG